MLRFNRVPPFGGKVTCSVPGAVGFGEKLSFSLDLGGVTEDIEVFLNFGNKMIPMRAGTNGFAVTVPMCEMIANEKCGILRYHFSAIFDGAIRYILWDEQEMRCLWADHPDPSRFFTLAVYRRYLETPDWLKSRVILVPGERDFSQLLQKLPLWQKSGISCLALGNIYETTFGKVRESLGGEKLFQQLLDEAFERDIGILLTLDFKNEKMNILRICRDAVELIRRGVSGFYLQNPTTALPGFFGAFRYSVRDISPNCPLLGDETVTSDFLLGDGVDTKLDIRPSEALSAFLYDRDAERFARVVRGLYQSYAPAVAVLLPMILEGEMPDFGRVLQYTLPGLPVQLSEHLTPLCGILGNLRREHGALGMGNFSVQASRDGLFSFERNGEGEKIRVIVNPALSQRTVQINAAWLDLFCGSPAPHEMTLAPGGFLVLQRQN